MSWEVVLKKRCWVMSRQSCERLDQSIFQALSKDIGLLAIPVDLVECEDRAEDATYV